MHQTVKPDQYYLIRMKDDETGEAAEYGTMIINSTTKTSLRHFEVNGKIMSDERPSHGYEILALGVHLPKALFPRLA